MAYSPELQITQAITPTQGNLFAMLPSRPRAYKSELEEEFLSPREQRLAKQLSH